VILVHSDLHHDSTLKLLRHTASTEVSISPALHSADHYASCQLIHKTASGKVIKWVSTEAYCLK